MRTNGTQNFVRGNAPEIKPMPVKIKVGKYDVVGNGSVICFEDDQVEFLLAHGDPQIKFTIVFDKSENALAIGYSQSLIGENHIRFRLQNFDNQLRIGFPSPEKVAIVDGRLLYMALLISRHNGITSMDYTFYLGEVV